MSVVASVLIPTYNRHDDLLHLLHDLAAQSSDSFEVVIVDDASTPPISEALAPHDFPYPIKLSRNEGNQGIGYSRNRCIDASTGAFILWIDSDSRVPSPDWIAWHVRQHQEGEPRLVHSEVQGATPNYAGRTFFYSNWFGSCGKVAKRAMDHHLPTNNTSLPRNLLDQVGRFDETLRAAEDVDWSLRALAQGIPLWYQPGMPVLHRDRDTLRAVWDSYRNIGKYGQRVRMKQASSPHGWLYPNRPALAPLYVMPLSILMTLYILWTWAPVDPRALLYTPGLYLANLAYALGVVDGLSDPAL